jgi:hypothetical protein
MSLRIAGALVGAGLVLTACGGGSSKLVAQPTVSPPVVSATPTPTPTVAPMKQTAKFSLAGNGGYTETVTLDVGSVQHYKPNLRNGSLVAGSACTIDPQKDAVLPMLLTATDTTPGALHQVPSVTLNLDSDTGSGPAAKKNPGYYQLDAEEGFSSPECETSHSGGSGWQTSMSVQGTQNSPTTALHAFLVIHNYYTPTQPEGNPRYFDPPIWSTDQSILDSSAPGIPSHVAVTAVWTSRWMVTTAETNLNQAIRTGGQSSSAPSPTPSPRSTVVGGEGAPPSADPGQASLPAGATLLGKADIEKYCTAIDVSLHAVLRYPNAWGWRCGTDIRKLDGQQATDQNVSVATACSQQYNYSGAISHYRLYSDPESWACYHP